MLLKDSHGPLAVRATTKILIANLVQHYRSSVRMLRIMLEVVLSLMSKYMLLEMSMQIQQMIKVRNQP